MRCRLWLQTVAPSSRRGYGHKPHCKQTPHAAHLMTVSPDTLPQQKHIKTLLSLYLPELSAATVTTSTHTHHLARRHTAPKSLPAISTAKHRNTTNSSIYLPAGGPSCFPAIKRHNLPSNRPAIVSRQQKPRREVGKPIIAQLPASHNTHMATPACCSFSESACRGNRPNAFLTSTRLMHRRHMGGCTRG